MLWIPISVSQFSIGLNFFLCLFLPVSQSLPVSHILIYVHYDSKFKIQSMTWMSGNSYGQYENV